MINSTREVFSDVDGRLSSKRVVTLGAFFLLSLAFVVNLFWDYTVNENFYDGMMWIVVGGLGIVGAEKFSKGRKNEEEHEQI